MFEEMVSLLSCYDWTNKDRWCKEFLIIRPSQKNKVVASQIDTQRYYWIY